MNTIRSPVAAAIPALRPFAKPEFGCSMTVNAQRASERTRSMTAVVSSGEPSFTSTTS